jgi:hypothetical protein
MLFWTRVAIYFKKHIKHVSTLCSKIHNLRMSKQVVQLILCLNCSNWCIRALSVTFTQTDAYAIAVVPGPRIEHRDLVVSKFASYLTTCFQISTPSLSILRGLCDVSQRLQVRLDTLLPYSFKFIVHCDSIILLVCTTNSVLKLPINM